MRKECNQNRPIRLTFLCERRMKTVARATKEFPVHWIVDMIGGAALLVLGFILGGTAAFYKGWDEGFREGFNKDIAERSGSLKAVPDTRRNDFPSRKAS
jgi:hypothetical protein